MEFSWSNIKNKILMLSQNKSFPVFSEMELYTSQTETKKKKKKLP